MELRLINGKCIARLGQVNSVCSQRGPKIIQMLMVILKIKSTDQQNYLQELQPRLKSVTKGMVTKNTNRFVNV